MTKTLVLVALLALAALPLVAPAADAAPECNAILGVSPWFSYSPHGCTAGTLVVCVPSATLSCGQQETVVLP